MSDGTREEEPPTHYLRQDNDGSGTQVWRIDVTAFILPPTATLAALHMRGTP